MSSTTIRVLVTAAAAAIVIATPAAPAANVFASLDDFQVNSYTTGNQYVPRLGTTADGDFVVAWRGYDGDNVGVFARRVDTGGTVLGADFQVNTYTTAGQYPWDVAPRADGGVVVVWGSAGQDGDGSGVFAQLVDSTGLAVGTEFQINTYTTGAQSPAKIALAADGGFVAVWESYGQDGDGSGVFGQRLDSTGAPLGTEFQINSYATSTQNNPVIAADEAGGFVVAWSSNGQDGDSFGIFAQRVDSVGAPVGTEFQINTYTTSGQARPGIARAADGAFAIVWGSSGQDGDTGGVFGQRLDGTGVLVGTEFQINTYTTSNQTLSRVAATPEGGFAVVWDSVGQDGSDGGVFGQRLDSAGAAVGAAFQVNAYTTGSQSLPRVRGATESGFLVVWSGSPDADGAGVFARRFVTLGAAGLDHFKCWKVKDLKNPKFAAVDALPLDDQFGVDDVDVKKPRLLCAPADKDGSGINDPDTHQCCYKIKGAKLDPAQTLEVEDQFGTLQFEIKKSDLLCQPCTKTLLP